MQLATPSKNNRSTKTAFTNPYPERIQINDPSFLKAENHTVLGKMK
jgi:hypothetical protein